MIINERFVNEIEASTIIGLSRSWLQKARVNGDGPPFVKRGRAVRYSLQKLIDYMNEGECSRSPVQPHFSGVMRWQQAEKKES